MDHPSWSSHVKGEGWGAGRAALADAALLQDGELTAAVVFSSSIAQ